MINSQESTSQFASLAVAFEKIDVIYKEDLEKNISIESHLGIDGQLFSYIKKQGWKLGILTGNTKYRMQAKLMKANIDSFFIEKNQYFCESKDTREDILKKAIRQINNDFESIIIIGDTPYDIRIAKESGLKCVAVSTGDYHKEKLGLLNPDLCLNNFHNELNLFCTFLENQ